MAYRSALEREKAISRWKTYTVVMLVVFNLFGLYGWNRARSDLTVRVPPDLRRGAVFKARDIPAETVYSFAFYIFQVLNNWPVDGAKDYKKNIYSYRAFLTPDFERKLLADEAAQEQSNTLSLRTRELQLTPGAAFKDDRVQVLSDDAWIVWIDFHVIERVSGQIVKDTNVRYPLRVVRYNVNPEENPWGLAIDGYARDPYRI